MQLVVEFAENAQHLEVEFAENAQHLNVEMREFQMMNGGGENGATFTPSVSPEGIISWTNDRNLPTPEPVKIKGADGRDGMDGKDGTKGDKGDKGEKGDPGAPGAKGDPGEAGPQGPAGANGRDGQDGAPGKDGDDGYTPVKGTDYFTDADKAEMVAAVIAALPVYGGETA